MTWNIIKLQAVDAVTVLEANMSDGLPIISTQRGPEGTSYRLYVYSQGMLDLTDMGFQPNGPHSWQVDINGKKYWYDGEGSLSIYINTTNQSYIVTGDGNQVYGTLMRYPVIVPTDISKIESMKSKHILPYGDVADGERPYDEVAPIAEPYFKFSPDWYNMGLCIYDWTTADFFRMDIFNWYRYTMLTPPVQLSKDDIVNAIWTSNWPPYTPHNETFMASMMMEVAYSEEEVATQYDQVHDELVTLLDALKRVTNAALYAMPRVSVKSIPRLYSGQVDVSNLGCKALATYFEEYPGNAGPAGSPMGMPIDEALSSFMAPGSTITLKSFVSFTNNLRDAQHYSNGIILVMDPPENMAVWPVCAYLTPISNDEEKTEYLYPAGSSWGVVSFKKTTFKNREYTTICLKDLGTK